VDGNRSGAAFTARITPLQLAQRLDADCQAALRLLSRLKVGDDASLRQEVGDVRAWANLGLHFAEKLRGAVALQTWRTQGDTLERQAAIQHLQKAVAYWDELIGITRPLYKDMPLAHYNGNAFTANPDNLFHWARVRDEVARDVEIAK